MELQAIVEELLETTEASRVTLRQDRPESVFPVTHEALNPGAPSIREVEAPNMPRQPVVLEIMQGRQVVQNDCLSAFDDPDFQRMLDLYGGLRAQIVTPVFVEGALQAIISVHQLARARVWSESEVEACTRAAERVGQLLALAEESG